MNLFTQFEELASSHGSVGNGKGLASGIIAFVLASLSLLAVIAFRFPAYLTTPELRHAYDVEVLRQLMRCAMIVAGIISVLNIILGRMRWLSFLSFLVLGAAELLVLQR